MKEKQEIISGIYSIINTKTGRRYIGSSVDIKRRLYEHSVQLRNNYHPKKYLQADYNRLGKESFKVEVIAEYPDLSRQELYVIEETYMSLFPKDTLYNSPGEQFTKWAEKHGKKAEL